MKKYFVWAVCVMAMCVMGSCGGDDEPSVEDAITKHLCGVQWKEHDTNRMVRMYRNHLVETWLNGKVVGGQLTYDDGTFYGAWSLVGDKLTTTFTAGNNTGFDQNMLMHGTMKVRLGEWNAWYGTDAGGKEHSYYYDNKSFTDYSDSTDHDGALHGQWKMNTYVDGAEHVCNVTVNGNGTVRFQIKGDDVDFTSNYRTKNGCVYFDAFMVPTIVNQSFIYTRTEADKVNFHTADKGVYYFSWTK